MLALKGVYEDGRITLPRRVTTHRKIEVVVTFLEEIEEPVTQVVDPSEFSFAKSRGMLRKLQGALSDAVVKERRTAL